MAASPPSDMSGMQPDKRIRLMGKTSPFYLDLLADMGEEVSDANQRVYLGTVSHVLPGAHVAGKYRNIENLDKAELASFVRDAFDNPITTGNAGGRPRTRQDSPVDMIIVVKEAHADGTSHFHFVVRLTRCMRFKQAKATLAERHQLPSHWSCTHTQLWSAVRYTCVPSPKKPLIDSAPLAWTHDGRNLDLVELSQEPFQATAWRQHREKAVSIALAEDKKVPSLNKLDFMALILSKHLHTKASLLSYVQDCGSPQAQLFASKHQRRLVEYIEDAQEWAEAKAMAGAEKLTEWDLLCMAADAPCKHPPYECSYALAVEEIFQRNAATLSPLKLAASLRQVLTHGPSKTCRVPFLVGPSNSGKSTLLYPFDDLFGPKHVFHKPALGSTFALRNIVKSKRFIFWDDYRPVEYAHKDTVPVTTFLSLFVGKDTEIQVSQSFNDGNLDVKWSRGVVFTAKEEGLWDPTSKVSAEDVQHLKNRVEEFRFSRVVSSLKEVESCAPCMARWIKNYSEQAAAALPPPGPPPTFAGATSSTLDFSAVAGFIEKMQAARIAGATAEALFFDVLALGAVDAAELTVRDWHHLPSWKKLKPLEARRLSATIIF